jgi:hypothetical protein
LAVTPAKARVEILVEPTPYQPRRNAPERKRILREHAVRRGDPNSGGSTRQPIMTAYRQQALDCAEAMRDGPKRPRDLRPTAPDAGGIMLRNVYGWFERVERGCYGLTDAGRSALERWRDGEAAP